LDELGRAAVGAQLGPQDDAARLAAGADAALYRAKAAGRDCVAPAQALGV